MNIAAVSFLLMLLASGWVWWRVFHRDLPAFVTELKAPSERPPANFLALALVIYLIGNGLLAKFGATPARIAAEIQLKDLQARTLEGLIVSALLAVALLMRPNASWSDYGITFRDALGQMLLGGLAFLASLLPVYALLLATSPLRSEETQHPFFHLLKAQPGAETVFWIAITVIFIAPLLEELIYRVILQTTLANWLPAAVAVPLAAGIFCLVHGWPDMLPLLPLALILGWVYERHRSYLAIVTTHGLFNAWMLFTAVLGPTAE